MPLVDAVLASDRTLALAKARTFGLAVAFLLPRPAAAVEPVTSAWPTKAWPESTPEAQGLDSAALLAFDRELAAGQQGYVDGMLVVRRGHVVFDKTYRHDYDALFAGKGGGPDCTTTTTPSGIPTGRGAPYTRCSRSPRA